MTSAIDELCRMLDEHDEYYKTSGNKTWWGRPIDRQTGKPINVFHYQAQPMGEDRLLIELQLATPEQAIAATLSSCNCSNNCANSERTRTCHITDNGPWGYPYVCSACGASFDPDVNNGEFNFCPNCGAKVVEPTTNDVDAEVDE